MSNHAPGSSGSPTPLRTSTIDMEQWEYKIVVKDAKDMGTPTYMESLNALGLDGWELVSVTPGNTMIKHFCYYFKRRLANR